MRISRDDRSLLVGWWFTVDWVLLTLIAILLGTGVVVSLAASPAVAMNKDLEAFHFVQRHVVFAVVGTVIMLVLSLLSPRAIRRLALLLFVVSWGLMLYIAVAGTEINGARRWIRIAGWSFQPSEVAKPAFAILAAWAFAEYERRRDVPAFPFALGLYLLFLGALVIQPDIGQSLLVTMVWGALFLLAGMPLVWAAAIPAASLAGLAVAYLTLPYVRGRMDVFFGSGAGDNSQIERAYRSFAEGGLFGRGPGEGTIKTVLPDAHTDFIFAVIAEEYGVIACLGLLVVFALVVFRAMARAIASNDLAVRYGVIGLALLIGGQALINMGVNVGLLPAKGMTLPLISAGGSSLIGVSITLGMMLALTRRHSAHSRAQLPRVELDRAEYGTTGR